MEKYNYNGKYYYNGKYLNNLSTYIIHSSSTNYLQ